MQPCRRPLCPEPNRAKKKARMGRVKCMFCSERCYELWQNIVVESRRNDGSENDETDGPPN